MSATEDRQKRLEALRNHLLEGERQAQRDGFVEDYDIDTVIAELDGDF